MMTSKGTVKRVLRSLLLKSGLYHRIKTSRAYDWYWSRIDPRLLAARDAEIAFYQRLLGGFRPNDLVFDIGANQGYKTDIFLRMGARVVSVDPDEQNQGILAARFLQFRGKKKPVTIVKAAVSDSVGTGTFLMDSPGSAKNTLSTKWAETLRADTERFGHTLEFAQKRSVQTTTLEVLIAEFGLPHFIKIDVEGHEPGVIAGLKTPVPYLSFEVNLPEFRDEGVQCIQRLSALSAEGVFNYATDSSTTAGLALPRWLPAADFESAFRACAAPSIEVFWRTCDLTSAR